MSDLPTITYAPAGIKYASVSQSPLWCLQFSDRDCGDQWFGGEGWSDEEAEAAAIEAWNRYAPAWSVRLMRTVTLDEVRAAQAGVTRMGGDAQTGSGREATSTRSSSEDAPNV